MKMLRAAPACMKMTSAAPSRCHLHHRLPRRHHRRMHRCRRPLRRLPRYPLRPRPPPPPTTPASTPPPTPAPPFPPPPPPPPPPYDAGFNARHIQLSISDKEQNDLALIDGDNVDFRGSSQDLSSVKSLQKGSDPMLWFRRNGKAYVVRDSAYVERAQGAYAPVVEISKMQGQLAGK